MLHLQRRGAIAGGALLLATAFTSIAAADPIQTVFVIAMENHNWMQPAQVPGGIQQIYQNPNAPFINSLVNGTASAVINGKTTDISQQTSYTSTYHNVLATPSGNNPSIHPSEPNYLWAEAGANFGVANDNDPYAPGGATNQNTTQHLTGLMNAAGKGWKSYQEDININTTNNIVLPKSQWTSPINSASGNFTSGTNAYNGSNQYNYAVKHDPMAFFSDTNGGNNSTPSNPAAQNYAPLQQLQTDLKNNTVANYNWITPDQYNDMHSTLAGGYKGLTGDSASIKQGDDFLSQIVPTIMASQAYQNNGAIVLWWDESESDGVAGDNANDFNHTIPEIVISSDAHANVNGLPYDSLVNYTHSSDLRTMQEIFGVGPFLGDAANANDLSDLFAPGAIPNAPEPATYAFVAGGLGLLALVRRRRANR